MKDIIATIVISVVWSAGVFCSGYRTAEYRFEHDRAVAMAAQGAKDYERLRKAIDVQDGLRNDLERARAESERVRRALDAARAARPADGDDGAGTSGCQELLGEAVELLEECRERYLSCAGRHDALVEAVK